MTITLFISMFTFGSLICALVTEAVKKAFENAHKEASANVLALVDAIVVGGLGTCVAYVLMGIPWTVNNIICVCLMVVCVWVGAMIGFDKVKQMLAQLERIKKGETNENS